MGKIGEAIVNSAVYENNTEYRGMADKIGRAHV